MRNPLHGVAIVGAYNTPQAKRLDGHTSSSVTMMAICGALDDAGLTFSDVDGFSVSPTDPSRLQKDESLDWAYRARLGNVWAGSAMLAIPGLLEAALAIASGQCSVVVVASGQAGLYSDRSSTAPWTRPANEFVQCWGLYTAAEYALVARRHMHEFGTTRRTTRPCRGDHSHVRRGQPCRDPLRKAGHRRDGAGFTDHRRSVSPARLFDDERGRSRHRVDDDRTCSRSRRARGIRSRRSRRRLRSRLHLPAHLRVGSRCRSRGRRSVIRHGGHQTHRCRCLRTVRPVLVRTDPPVRGVRILRTRRGRPVRGVRRHGPRRTVPHVHRRRHDVAQPHRCVADAAEGRAGSPPGSRRRAQPGRGRRGRDVQLRGLGNDVQSRASRGRARPRASDEGQTA